MECTKNKEAGRLLAEALKSRRAGHVARVRVPDGMVAAARHLAMSRRIMARFNTERSYSAAMTVDTLDPSDVSNLAADNRGILAELLVRGMLREARVAHESQHLVDYLPAKGADLTIGGLSYDVKAAGQTSWSWSPGAAHGRFSDDEYITVNYQHHLGYCAPGNFGGYLCVYFYIEDDYPLMADLFIIDADNMGRLYPGRIKSEYRDMRYYSPALPFPDERHCDGFSRRVEAARHAEPSPFAVADI